MPELVSFCSLYACLLSCIQDTDRRVRTGQVWWTGMVIGASRADAVSGFRGPAGVSEVESAREDWWVLFSSARVYIYQASGTRLNTK
jgi:hypothetical protein